MNYDKFEKKNKEYEKNLARGEVDKDKKRAFSTNEYPLQRSKSTVDGKPFKSKSNDFDIQIDINPNRPTKQSRPSKASGDESSSSTSSEGSPV
jgi:hypothetical protein